MLMLLALTLFWFNYYDILAADAHGDYIIETSVGRSSGRINQILDEPIKVRITDLHGEPVEDVKVEFYSSKSDLTVKNEQVYTDHNGIAQTFIRLGQVMGDYEIETRIYLPNEVVFDQVTVTAFDYRKLIFYIIGGLGIFLFGIRKVSESLRIAAGDNLKRILSRLTTNRWLGAGVGVAVTALLQSSSATTVMSIGFVNAGLLTLRQAISVLIGANVGTTITAQIIAFKVGEVALPAVALGTLILLFSKSYRVKAYGSIILGFGFLFFGLNMMTDVVTPLRSSVFVSDFFLKFSHNYLLAIFAGTLMTVIVQSSSATVGITIVLAVSGLIDIYSAMALVLGDNIGTTVTGALASIGGSVNARRTALSNVFIKIIGAGYMVVLLIFFAQPMASLLESISSDLARQVANFHTFFNVFNSLIFLPLIPLLQKTVCIMIPDTVDKKKEVTVYLSNELLNEPSIAIDQIKLELSNMIGNVEDVFKTSMKSLDSINRLLIEETFEFEAINDRYQLEITEFIAKLSRRELSNEDADRLPVLLHLTNDLEKAADFSRNIAEIAERKLDKEIEFNKWQKESLDVMADILIEMLKKLPVALEHNDQEMAHIVAILEQKMDKCEIKFKKQQIRDISSGQNIESAIMVMDIITNIEKAGDHLFNLAQAVMGALSEDKKALYSDLLVNTTVSELK